MWKLHRNVGRIGCCCFWLLAMTSLEIGRLARLAVSRTTSSNDAYGDGSMVRRIQEEQVDTTATLKPIIFNYHQDPDSFVASLVDDCIQPSPSTTTNQSAVCHLYYWHVGKTGGTTLETTFWSEHVFGPPVRDTMRDTCCNKPLEQRVQHHLAEYCASKFVSLQVSGTAFREFVRKCHQYHHDEQQQNHQATSNHHNNTTHGAEQSLPQHHEIRVLVSFREPSHLTLSTIHQYCNKNLETRSPQLLSACQHCQYETDAPYWDYIVTEINRVYADLFQWFQPLQNDDDDTTHHRPPPLPVQVLYAIELPDMNDFTHRLYARLPKSPQHFITLDTQRPNPVWNRTNNNGNTTTSGSVRHTHHANPEKTSHCSFGMTSPMFKGLEPSRLIYRQLLYSPTMSTTLSSSSSATTRTAL